MIEPLPIAKACRRKSIMRLLTVICTGHRPMLKQDIFAFQFHMAFGHISGLKILNEAVDNAGHP